MVLVHMYLGVGLALLFVMWFVSGVVLAFNPYPSITPDERTRLLPVLDCEQCTVSVDDALRLASIVVTPVSRSTARLGMLGSRPVWRVTDGRRGVRAVYADSARAVPAIDSVSGAPIAIAVGRIRAGRPEAVPRARFLRTLTTSDQWTLEAPLPAQLPLLEFDLGDAASTHVYVSTAGAEAVTATTGRGRTMAWIGAIPHWIYPVALRRNVRAWSWVIIVLGAFGTLMSIAGIVIGVWQWRSGARRIRRDGSLRARSPYRDPIMRWHHLLGLTFGVFTFSWIFSGLLSVNPGDWSPGTAPDQSLTERWYGVLADSSRISAPRAAWKAAVSSGVAVREMLPVQLSGRSYWLTRSDDGSGTLVAADTLPARRVTLREAELIALADEAMLGAGRMSAENLTEYDDHYRATEGRTPVLPVLRLKYRDAARTWLYIDPETASLAAAAPSRARAERWLYSGLHDLDFAFLMARPALRNAVLVGLSAGGLLSSLAGLLLAVRWIRELVVPGRHFRRR
jgi:hypothetical protein